MSGYKRATISIGQDEYDRLQEAEARLRTIPPIVPAVIQDISQRSLAAFQTNLDRLQQRQRVFDNMVSGLDRSVQELERGTNQALVELERNILQETRQNAGNLWNYFAQALSDQQSYFDEKIAASHRYFQHELTQQTRQLRRMEEDGQRKREMAEMWLDSAAQFHDFIVTYYDLPQFAPGEVEYLETRLAQANDNFQAGLSEAAIVSAQQIYMEFSDLRIHLERWHNAWNLLYQATWETVSLIIGEAEGSRTVPAFDMDGQELPNPIEVNYWTGGRLDDLLRELNYIRERLEDPNTRLPYDLLDRWMNIDLPGYDQALADIVHEARITALNSQLRINIADLVIQALQEQGFALEASDYEAEDMRETFNARLSSFEGNEVLVNVVPVGRGVGENELHLQSLDREVRTENELQHRWIEIDRSLASYGLEVSGVTRVDGANSQTRRSKERETSQSFAQARRSSKLVNSG